MTTMAMSIKICACVRVCVHILESVHLIKRALNAICLNLKKNVIIKSNYKAMTWWMCSAQNQCRISHKILLLMSTCSTSSQGTIQCQLVTFLNGRHRCRRQSSQNWKHSEQKCTNTSSLLNVTNSLIFYFLQMDAIQSHNKI